MRQEAELLKSQVENLIELDARTELIELLNNQNIADVAEVIDELEDHQKYVFSCLEIQRAVAVFRVIDFGIQNNIVQRMKPTKVAELLNELPPDDRTAFLSDLPSETVKEFIKLLRPEERKETLMLMGYPEESIGRLMTPDYIDVEPEWTVQEVLDYIRSHGHDSETLDVIYVTNREGVLLDDIRIREFLLVDPYTRVEDLMDDRVISLDAMDDEEEVVSVFQRNHRVALPVVDKKQILLGIVTIDDVLVLQEEESTEDFQKIGGTEAFDESYLDIDIFKMFRKRGGWLVLLLLGEMITIVVTSNFESSLNKITYLAFFVPLVMSAGGNSGSQASTLIIRAMALDEVDFSDWLTVFRRELISGLLLGSVLGVIGFFRVILWNQIFDDYNMFEGLALPLAFTVGSSLLVIVLWGTICGSMLPLLLKKLGADPATSSSPFVATLVDITGLFFYFSLSYLFLNQFM